MIIDRTAASGLILVASLALGASHQAYGRADSPKQDEQQQTKPKIIVPAGGGASVQVIDEDYNRQLLQLERQRIERLSQLAAQQPPKDAQETYELLFRRAISNNLFREAEATAQHVVKSGSASPLVSFLAHSIDIIGSADRGEFDESLAELRRVMESQSQRGGPGQGRPPVMDTRALLTICEAYYQRLLQADRFDIAKNAFQLISKEAENATVKGFCSSRLNQLEMLGKPAPAIQGTDLDGKPIDLTSLKGNVVLVVFWASWCVPSSAEVAWLEQVYSTYQPNGFRILGINLDPLQKDNPKLEALMPSIKRFVIEHNVRWPNLVNGAGAQDYATAYGVAEIPTNVLIGREGTVIHLDLSRKNLDRVVARAVGP